MGKIADKIKKGWYSADTTGIFVETLAKAIDAELEALRQEIRDLRKDIYKDPQPKIEIDKDGSIVAKTPEPELQRGDLISYVSDGSVTGRKMGHRVWGIFHHQDDREVWGYFQEPNGDFPKISRGMPRNRITFEFRPDK